MSNSGFVHLTCPCLWYRLLCQSYSLYRHGRKARRMEAMTGPPPGPVVDS